MNTGADSFGSLGVLMDSSTARVRCQNIWEVVCCDTFEVNNFLDDEYEPREPYIIVKQAREMVGQELPYSLTSSNCEHFVTWLRYGKPESRQVGVLLFLYRLIYQTEDHDHQNHKGLCI